MTDTEFTAALEALLAEARKTIPVDELTELVEHVLDYGDWVKL